MLRTVRPLDSNMHLKSETLGYTLCHATVLRTDTHLNSQCSFRLSSLDSIETVSHTQCHAVDAAHRHVTGTLECNAYLPKVVAERKP